MTAPTTQSPAAPVFPDFAPVPRNPVIEKYTGVLAGADIFTESTAFWVMESIRLDVGYGSQVHP